jgi:MoaA/NifB/PqqE/SkfB family radical SAM enzyme
MLTHVMNEIIKKLLAWKNGSTENPYSIELSPTLKCNLNCLFCWRHSVKEFDTMNELNFSTYKRLIEEAKKLDVKEIKIIGGGEATCRKDTFKIMELIKKNNMFGYICTNGTLFHEDEVKKLVHIGWDHIKISLHGPNAEIHDFLTSSNGSFKKAINTILLFKKYKHILKKDKPYIELGIVLVNKNFNRIIDFVRLAKKLNVDAVFLEPITTYSENGDKLKLNKKQIEETKKILKKAIKLTRTDTIDNNFLFFIKDKLIEKTNVMNEVIVDNKNMHDFINIPCYEPFYRMGIRMDGIVCPCGFFDESSTENIRHKSLREIWFGDYFNNRRRQMLENKLSDYCKKCCTTLVVNNLILRKKLQLKTSQ